MIWFYFNPQSLILNDLECSIDSIGNTICDSLGSDNDHGAEIPVTMVGLFVGLTQARLLTQFY